MDQRIIKITLLTISLIFLLPLSASASDMGGLGLFFMLMIFGLIVGPIVGFFVIFKYILERRSKDLKPTKWYEFSLIGIIAIVLILLIIWGGCFFSNFSKSPFCRWTWELIDKTGF